MSQCIHRRPYPIPAQTCLFSNRQGFVTLICHFADIKTFRSISSHYISTALHDTTSPEVLNLTTVHAIAIFHNITAPNPSILPSIDPDTHTHTVHTLSFQSWSLRMFPVWIVPQISIVCTF